MGQASTILVFLLTLVALGAPARATDIFNLRPDHRVSTFLSGDSDKGRSLSLDGNFAFANAWSVGLGGRTREVSFANETTQSKAGYLLLATDPFSAWVFDLGLDREFQDGHFTDSGANVRATWQPVRGWISGWALWVGIGARQFEFSKVVTVFAPRPTYEIESRIFKLGVDIPIGRQFALTLEGETRAYPDEIKEMNRDIVALLVPVDTLAYAFALPKETVSASVHWHPRFWRRHKPGFRLGAIASRAAVDDAQARTLSIDAGLNLSSAWRINLGAAGTRSTGAADAADSGTLSSFGLGLAFSWQ